MVELTNVEKIYSGKFLFLGAVHSHSYSYSTTMVITIRYYQMTILIQYCVG